jgi:hypothetical protein
MVQRPFHIRMGGRRYANPKDSKELRKTGAVAPVAVITNFHGERRIGNHG